MKLETKYDIGEEVYYMENNKVKSMIIQGVRVSKQVYYDRSSKEQTNTYTSDMYGGKDHIHEDFLFRTKEELLNTL